VVQRQQLRAALKFFVTALLATASSASVKRRIVVWGLVAVLALVSFGGYLVYRAKNDLVTLDVRNMDVHEVAAKVESQTREKIIIHKDVQGKITLNVKQATLADVLGIIADQTSARWATLYPLYTSDESVERFKKVARGDLPTETSGWTNFQVRGFGRGPGGPGGFGFMGDALGAQGNVIDFDVVNRDLPFAAVALARFGQLVPENGTAGNITVRLKQVPVTKAVAAVADHVKRKWDQYYLVYSEDFGRGGEFTRGDRERGGERRFGGDNTNRFDPQFAEARREEFQAQREKQFEAQLATMTPEQQTKVKDERKQMEELRNLSPEERQQRFEQMAARPEFQQRMEQRSYRGVMNTTPEQRAERTKARIERMQRRQQQQGNNNNR
jgi:hypothetical protein